MKGRINPKILGSIVVGVALVGGAYTAANFGKSRYEPPQPLTNEETGKTKRVIVDITDNDNNGIEDWRDDFVAAAPVVLNTAATSTYTPPETLTGQMSISVLERMILSRGYGAIGDSDAEIIQDTINTLERETTQTLYDIEDIEIITDWSNEDIVNYANTVANTVFRHNDSSLEGELVLLENVARNNDSASLQKLQDLAGVYQNYRDDTLKIPVPTLLVKEHLDLINSYTAVYEDILAMGQVDIDAIVTLLRLRRYQDDATALGYSYQNMFFALDNSGATFTPEDPAQFFALFSPDYNAQ